MLKFILIKCLILSFIVWGNAQTQTIEEERIIEKVEVTNVEVPVRVFFKGKPVQGLEKTDFKLFVNGKEKEIHGFFEYKKKLTMTQAPQLRQEPGNIPSSRLFLLIFNIYDYHLDVSNSLDIFFDKIFRANDRLMVITNRFFFDDRKISNPRQEKMKLKKVLQSETEETGKKIKILEQQLQSLIRSYKNHERFRQRSRGSSLQEADTQAFISGYSKLIKNFKGLDLNLSTNSYIKLARYLKAQKAEKWVLNFYQIGRFFKLKLNSGLLGSLLGIPSSDNKSWEYAKRFGPLFSTMKSYRTYDQLYEELEIKDTLPQEDLSKLFANTGATFHTILMEDFGAVRNDMAEDLTYIPVISDTYNLLKDISKETGGSFINSNKTEKFYKKITSTHDIFYMLTYVPGKGENNKKKKINVKVNNKKYRVYYDDGKRGSYFRKLMKKEQTEPFQIRIDNVDFNNNLLSFVVSNFKINEPGSDQPTVVKIPVRLQVFNRESESIFNGVEMFTIKDLKKSKVKLQIAFPKFSAGVYDVFIWVGDLLTGKNDLAVKVLKFL